MSRTRLFSAVLMLLVACAVLAWGAYSDLGPDKKSTLTVTDRVEIPGTVLEPGTYVVKLVDAQNNRNIVQVTDVAEAKVYATMIATPHVGATPPENTTFTFYTTPAGSPRVLRTWFAPNDRFGQDFYYPAERAAQLAALTKEKVPEMTADMSKDLSRPPENASAPMTREQPAQVATSDTSRPQPESTTAENEPPRELPKTASPYPLLLVFGFTALAGAAALHFSRKSA